VAENQAWFWKGIWVGALAAILVCAAAIGGGLATYFMLREQAEDARTGTIEVDARKGWQSTEISVEEGIKLTIEVIDGQWTRWKDSEPYNIGEGGGYVCAKVIPASQCVEPLPDFPAGGLIGQIGSQILGVGRGSTVVAHQSGTLLLRINDGDDGLYDNDGKLTVNITVSPLSGDSCTPTLPTTMDMSKVTPTFTPRPSPQIVIHVTGIVLDADQLPKEMPVAGATVTVYNLRGVPVDGASVRTQTDKEGRFELWIPMKMANYPYWWGNIQVDASGYSSASANVLCCSNDPSAKDCSGKGSCGAGTGGFYKIGLSRHPPEGVIHVAGIVLDADQMPKVPIMGATVTVDNIRGVLVDRASVFTQTDMGGRFELWIPIEIEEYPFWLGDMHVEAPGYSSSYHKCDPQVDFSRCAPAKAPGDRSAYYRCYGLSCSPCTVVLSRHGPTPQPVPNTP
jgi:hypothetical protein